MTSEIEQGLRQAAAVSESASALVVEHFERKLREAGEARADVAVPAWGDRLFGEFWSSVNRLGLMGNRRPMGVFSFAQVIENLTAILGQDKWRRVHKGTHYYNVGLADISRMEVDRAFKYFLLADEEDERNKGTMPGDLFRSSRIFTGLRASFFSSWFEATDNEYHDQGNAGARLDRFGRLIAALPGRYLLARCHVGVFRACVLWHQRHGQLPSQLVERLMAIEDLAVLTEAVAAMLDSGSTSIRVDGAMLGPMLAGSKPVGMLGFVLGATKLDLNDEAAARSIISAGLSADRKAMSRVVQRFRNLSAHASDAPRWLLDGGVLADVLRVQLDFISIVAAAYETRHGPLANTAPAPPAAPLSPGAIMACASTVEALPPKK